MTQMMGRGELLGALVAMDEELGKRHIKAELFVVGGAAMALAYDARRATSDLDAVFVPADVVREVAEKVATDLGLEPN